jgi:glycosyltransferase involved in cell wall biosynthesis
MHALFMDARPLHERRATAEHSAVGTLIGLNVVSIAWARFQPRAVSLSGALGGEAYFFHSRRLDHRRALLPIRYVMAAVQTWRLLERRRPACVLVATPPVFAPLAVWLWCALRRSDMVLDCHPPGAFDLPKWAWARPLHRILAARSFAVLLHTRPNFELVESWGGRALLLIDDLSTGAEASQPPAGTAAEVVVAGSFDANEPVASALAAAKLLPEITFAFTGDPKLLPSSIRSAVPANVRLTGYLPHAEFLGLLKSADVVAVLSNDPHIFTPRAAFESVGLGRPVILLDLPGVRSRFEDAAIFTSPDAESIAAAICRALEERMALAEKSRARGAELRAERFVALERLLKILNQKGETRAVGKE